MSGYLAPDRVWVRGDWYGFGFGWRLMGTKVLNSFPLVPWE